MQERISLNSDVQIYPANGEIRFRKGVWNHYEATLVLVKESEAVQRVYRQFMADLMEFGAADTEAMLEAGDLAPEERRQIGENLRMLHLQGFLVPEGRKQVEDIISVFMAGKGMGFPISERVMPVLLVTDNREIASFVRDMGKRMQLPVDVMDDAMFKAIQTSDLTTKTDAITHDRHLQEFAKQFQTYAAVGMCFSLPSVTFLRNMNRIALETRKPLVTGFMDGPFLSFMVTDSESTGCLECFEQRIMARLQDIPAYQRYVKNTVASGARDKLSNPGFAPFLSMLASLVITELYMMATVRMSRMAGRVLNIYTSVMEIQCQDLLRIPYCPACGHVSKSRMDEMYSSSKSIVEQLLNKFELTA